MSLGHDRESLSLPLQDNMAFNLSRAHSIAMQYLLSKKAISVVGFTLFCLAYITAQEEDSPLAFLRIFHSSCIYLMYLSSIAYFFLRINHKLEFGHEIYLFYCLYMFATLAWSDYPTEIMISFGHNLGLFFVCIMLCDLFEGDYERFLWALLLNVSAVSALSVIVTIIWPDIGIIYNAADLNSEFSSNGRWSGITDGPNTLGILAALGLITGVYLLLECGKASKVVSSGYVIPTILVTLLANSVALIGSDSKTSLSSAMAGLLFYFFGRNVLGWFQHRRLKKLSTNFIIGLAATAGLVGLIKTTEVDKLLFVGIGRDTELTGRTWLWKLGWDAISERPITGWSFDQFYTLKDTYGAFEYNQFHNGLIDLLAKGGIIALILGLIMLIDFISKLDRGEEDRHAVQFVVLYLPFLLVSSYAEARLFRPECFVWFIFIFCWFYLLRRTRGSHAGSLALTTLESKHAISSNPA